MRVLIVEDEQDISLFTKKALEEFGYSADQAFDGEMALRLASNNHYDCILLDVVLPKYNGFELCNILRSKLGFKNSVIMLTALGATEDIVKGLENGADDYLVKPYKVRELVARIKAAQRGKNLSFVANEINVDDLTVNMDAKTVVRDGKEIKLTAKEFRLLEYLLRNKNRVVSRMDVLENVWDINFDLGTNVVDVYINYLRNKVDKEFESRLIHTVVGMGYVLKDPK